MLTAVEYQQQLAVFQKIDQRLHDWAAGVITKAERHCSRQCNLIWLEERREINPAGTVRYLREADPMLYEAQANSFLRRPSEQRHESRLAQKKFHVIYLTLPADKARRPGGHVVALNWRDEAVTLSRNGLDASRRN